MIKSLVLPCCNKKLKKNTFSDKLEVKVFRNLKKQFVSLIFRWLNLICLKLPSKQCSSARLVFPAILSRRRAWREIQNRISANIFRPWIASSLEYFLHFYVTVHKAKFKKDCFRRNYSRKYGMRFFILKVRNLCTRLSRPLYVIARLPGLWDRLNKPCFKMLACFLAGRYIFIYHVCKLYNKSWVNTV